MNYGNEKKGTSAPGLGPDTASVAKRSLESNPGKSREPMNYKKDFAKINEKAPDDWGKCLSGQDGPRDY